MTQPELIDLHHQGHERTVACYLLDTDDGPALFDCGPAATIAALETGLDEHGVKLTDVRHLLLSHIHLDHAGAAGVLVRMHPQLQVHVSAIGARYVPMYEIARPAKSRRKFRSRNGSTRGSLRATRTETSRPACRPSA